jgi:DNA/RNA-binding domain of Phe-tRNA-synthetase-like protein
MRSIVIAELSGLKITASNPQLEDLKASVTARLQGITDAQLAANEVLEGYRELVRKVGRSVKKFPPAAEKLLAQIRDTQRFPSVNTAVDCYNVVVAQRLLALGVHDVDKLSGDVTFRLSDGGEPFVSVGGQRTRYTQAGDYLYADEHQILAWLDSKDSDRVKVSTDTSEMIIVIQGTMRTSVEYNLTAAREACDLVSRFCGGSFDIRHLPPR